MLLTEIFYLLLLLLALAAECIGLQIELIPHLKQRLQHYLPLTKHHVLLLDLDRVVNVRQKTLNAIIIHL